MAIKYKDFEKREQLRKDYIDKAAEAAKTQANAYTDEQIRNIPAPPAPDIPTALPQKYEAFKVQLVQGNISEGEDPMWSEYHKPLWNGSQVLTNSSATLANKAHFVTDTVLYWRSPRKYNLLITINGAEKEFVFEGEHNQYGTNWVIWQLKENNVVVAEAECIGAGNGQYYNNTSTVYVYCPDGSSYIGQTMTAARYGKKQYVYSLMNPAAILQYPSETENTRFLTMCKSIATKNAKLKLTLTDNVIEANYANISNELVTTDYVNGDNRIRWIGIVADRVPNKANGTDIHDDMPTCIKGVLEVEYTDEEATKECVYDKIQGESYTFKIGDFNHEESSAFDYYFNGASLIPWDNAQLQAIFTYRPVSGEEDRIQVKSMVNNGQMMPHFDISELFGQAAGTVTAALISNAAIENSDMIFRPVTTITLTTNIQNFTDANDEIMVSQILTLSPTSLPQTYKKKAVTLAASGWVADNNLPLSFPIAAEGKKDTIIYGDFSAYRLITDKTKWNCSYTLTKSDGTKKDYNWQTAYKIEVGTYYPETYVYFKDNHAGTYSEYPVLVRVYNNRIEIGPSGNISLTSLGAGIALQKQSYTDADVKVNSEVRFTLDEAKNGKIAGQFGLKKTIDKEAGKLTFTADTLPTSAITGTLEIGETSTEGAAFVEGITLDTTGFVKATEENTFTAKQTFQDVQINGNLTAKGTTTTVDVKNLDVEQQLITVAKGNTAALTSPAGLKAEKYDGTKDGALVFDASGMAMVGDVVLDANGNIDEAQSDLQDLATRAKPSELTDGHLLKWDATNKKIVDGGEASSGGTVTSVSVKMNSSVKGTVTTSGTIDLGTVLTSWDDVGSEAVISIIGKALYPVGAIYMSTANVNPSTFITGTTWVAWGSGRVPVGIDISDTDFNGVEKTGGEKTHTLTESEMPKHNHTGTEQEAQKFNIEQGSTFETKRYTASFTSETMQTASNSVANPNGSLSGSGEVVVEHGITSGGGQPHNILQPYITCYMWKRTA